MSMAPRIDDVAREAVDLLGARKIEQHLDRFRAIIEECDRLAGDSDAFFLETAIRRIEPLIHYLSTRDRLVNAIDWIVEQHRNPRADALAVLVMLTLVDVVNRISITSDADWNRIQERVRRLTDRRNFG